mmetsp:Transcript_15167/g.18393  ORF Transcript_15167/g.18393 Transcript_15167/m.18393 type:complete len:375 (-) Transcript_15167:1061-2185(-)|eukprot:CAMPEP_0184027570 /NCGR_PEP_ID=MMETSP0954-20121128/14280_1 /TAXON_ID=627963 /ORGANISM="Aplanochytrium sp, Strain PBS07" /LENGTH=374 /DNA_ID=CAMNT_0026312161 /DNA_START=132 /DNA_END=1256 /DNA_ORIENTATION=+
MATAAQVKRIGLSSKIRVVTYNVLSQKLCSPEQMYKCDPKDLVPETRFENLISKVSTEVKKGSILTFQEVSQTWAGKLHCYFSANNYCFVVRLYGGKHSDYMGVGIAVPMEKYTIENVDIQRISDTVKWPRKPEPTRSRLALTLQPITDYLLAVASPLISIAGYVPGIWKEEKSDNTFDFSMKRYNGSVSVELKERSNSDEALPFWVSTYHMPCAFWNQKIMMIHAALAVSHAQKLAGESPLIFTGDFNLKPGDAAYELITNGEIDTSRDEYPQPPAYAPDFQVIPRIKKMRSAYKEKTGSEPVFTNYNWSKPWNSSMKDEPFIGCLDYIFLSKHFDVCSVRPLYASVEESNGPFPTGKEPSDHLMLAADLDIN